MLIHKNSSNDSEAKYSGFIVDTFSANGDTEQHRLLFESVLALKCNVVLVIDNERLYNDFTSHTFGQSEIEIIKIPKSGGVVSRDARFRRAQLTSSVREYFYGVKKELSPMRMTLPFSKIQIFRCGGGPQAPSSALPIGTTSLINKALPVLVQPTKDLQNSVLALSYAQDEKQILESSVAGFVYVSAVNFANATLTLLSPRPGPLPGLVFVVGNLECFLE